MDDAFVTSTIFFLLISIYKVLTRTCTQLYLVAKSRQCVDIAQSIGSAIRFVFTTRGSHFCYGG